MHTSITTEARGPVRADVARSSDGTVRVSCNACGTLLVDDDRSPFYDAASDDGTPHACPPFPTPTISDVTITPDEPGLFSVRTVWANVDRPDGLGYVVRGRPLAERLARAITEGAVFYDVRARLDYNGLTFATHRSRVLGRMMNADLRRLGY